MSPADAIRAAREAINEAIARRDPAGIAGYLLESYHVLTARSVQRHGRDASAQSWADLFARDASVTYRRVPDEIHVHDEWGMAAEHGRWSGTSTEDGVRSEFEGVYAAKWQLTADGWRLQAEMFTALVIRRG